MYNLVIWSIFHTFAPRDISLKERNTFLLNNSQCLIVVAVPHSNIIVMNIEKNGAVRHCTT